MQIEELILKRWSPRAFSSKPVEPEKLDALFEAARWAPSSSNQQPWRFVYATREEPEAWQKLFDTLMEGNQPWNVHVPVLIAIVAKLTSDRQNKPNRHAFYDTGQSEGLMTLQATKMGLYTHQMGGFYPEKVKETMNIPDGFETIAMMALGYMGDKDELPEPFRTREIQPRTRHEVSEFVFKGSWNGPR
jgi:nitroreductase